MINKLLVPVALFVIARSSAEWIPPVSNRIDSVVDQRPLADGKRKLRVQDEAPKEADEERGGSPPHLDPQVLASFVRNGESSSSPLAPILEPSKLSWTKDKSIAEPLSATLNAPNKLDVSHLKSNIAFTQRMAELRINFDDVVVGVQRLRENPDNLKYDDKTLILMGFGSVYFDKLKQYGIEFYPVQSRVIDNLKDMFTKAELTQFERRKAGPTFSSHRANRKLEILYAKIRWLARQEHFKMSLMELVDMASGSELFSAYEIITPPKSETLDQLHHLIGKLISRYDVELKVKEKLQTFAEDSSYIGKTEEELLERAKVAVFDDEFVRNKQKVEHLKEDHKVFTRRMENLGINIDDVVDGVQILPRTPVLKHYNDYSLTLMALGFEYFKTIKAPASRLKAIELKTLADAMGHYADSKHFKDWKAYRVQSGVSITKVYAKMRWLKEEEDLKMKDEELAELAFGSEFFRLHKVKPIWLSLIRDEDKIETLDQLERLINQLPETRKRVGEPNVKAKLRAMAKNPVSFFGKTAKELVETANREAVSDELSKETNKRRKIA